MYLLDNVVSNYDVSSDVEKIIDKGPGLAAEGGLELENYLQSLNRLAKAQKYFEKNIPQSVELENVVCILIVVKSLLGDSCRALNCFINYFSN